jgi:TRAP-type uncharacterized transport system substrate-binding protein
MALRIKLFFLNLRDLLVSAGPLLVLALGLLAAAYWWLDPQPPKTVRLATGPEGSAYAGFGSRYARALAREGIRVELVPTEGSLDNLQRLREGQVDLAFVRGGTSSLTRTRPVLAGMGAPEGETPDPDAELLSLGALFYDPLWIFYREEAAKPAAGGQRAPEQPAGLRFLGELRGLRVNVDQAGSGVPQLMERLFRANGMDEAEMTLSHLPPTDAAQALLAGDLDVAVLTSAPQSAVVRDLLRAPDIRLLDLAQANAYARRFAFMRPVVLPRGVADLAEDLPPQDVTLLAASSALLTREQTHPALRQLFAQAAQTIHSRAGWLNEAREFPNTRTSELPVSAEGDRAINGKPPFWQRYLPFWASNVIERMWLVIGGLIVLILPLSRIVPPLYTFRVRRRVFRWYARLRDIEARAEAGTAPRDILLKELDDLDRVANGIAGA